MQRTGNICLVLRQVEVVPNVFDDWCCRIGTAASTTQSGAGDIDAAIGQAAADSHLINTVKKAIQLR